MSEFLDYVNSPSDLKSLNENSLNTLSQEIREFLIKNVSSLGGHLASNLGCVELTLALHLVFNSADDKIIFDVGHQSYTHKIITGRRDEFTTLRQKGGLSGFPKPSESSYDPFYAGHAGTSLSVALGFEISNELNGVPGNVVAVVGDASFGNGMAFEALNQISHLQKKVIIVLNDNQMSIDKATGALSKYLNKVRISSGYYKIKRKTKKAFIKLPIIGKALANVARKTQSLFHRIFLPSDVFTQLGLKYLGPVDGHNITATRRVLEEAKKMNKPVIVHVCTVKGKGLDIAERSPEKYHSVNAANKKSGGESFASAFGKELCHLANENKKVVAVCPAMQIPSGLSDFTRLFPDRFFDAGIAEGHAATLSAALAASGSIPVFSVYSTFLQRAYDSLIHDIAIGNYHTVIAIDRAGVTGNDGETHQGVFDLSFLNHIPNMTILAPCDNQDLSQMLEFAVCKFSAPIAIRYPRGFMPCVSHNAPFEFCKAEKLKDGADVSIFAVGKMVQAALSAAEILKANGISADVFNLRTVKPLDLSSILTSAEKTGLAVTLEDNVVSGGIGQQIALNLKCPVIVKGYPDTFIEQAEISEIMQEYKLDANSIAKEILERKNESKT